MELNEEQLNPEEKDLIYFKQLEKVPKEEIRELYEILKIFNQNVTNILPLLDLHIEARNKMTMIQKSFVGSRCYIFDELKKKQFNDFITKTNVDTRASITIDRPKAARHKQRGAVDTQA
jgi:hypothetical protein